MYSVQESVSLVVRNSVVPDLLNTQAMDTRAKAVRRREVVAFATRTLVPMMALNRELRYVFANAAYCDEVGETPQSIVGKHVLDIYKMSRHDQESFIRKCAISFTGEVTRSNVQKAQKTGPDGKPETIYWQTTQEPFFGDNGEVRYIVQRVEDVTHLIELKNSNDTITAELDHRVKNLMTVVLATARISSATATSIEQYTEEFCQRLESMTRYYNKLCANGWRGLSFREMLEEELAQAIGRGSDRYSLKGDDLIMSLKSTKDGGMVIHELVSNAVKHGCFSRPEGRLHVEWARDGDMLRFLWIESGLQGVKDSGRFGFGSKLLSMMPNARIRREFRDTGLWLEYSVPFNLAIEGVEFEGVPTD